MSNQNIEVYIDNFKVDIGKTSAIQIKKQFRDVKEFSKKKTSFSKPIKVLFTQNNAALFGAAFNINEVGGWDKNSRPVAIILENGLVQIEGFAKLDKISNGYSFVVYKDGVSLNSLIGNSLIRGNANSSDDVNFINQYSFDFTRPNLRSLMQSLPRKDGKGINYGYADLIGIKNLDYNKDRLMIPSIAVRELLEEVLLSVGKIITFSTGIEKYINSMYMPFNSEYKELTTPWDYAKYSVSSPDLDGTSTFVKIALMKGLICNFDKIQDIPTEVSSIRGSVSLPNEVGEYTVTFKCKVKKDSEGGVGVPNPEVKPKIILHTGDISPLITTDLKLINLGSDPDAGIILSGTSFHEATFKTSFKLQGGTTSLFIGFETNELPNGEGPLTCSSDGTTNIEIEKVDSYYNEDTPTVITSDKILPVNYKKIDLFNDVVMLFNAITTSDGDNIHMTTANEFNSSYVSPFFDLSGKVDEDEIELSTLLSRTSEVSQFKFLESNDLHNIDYKEQFNSVISDIEVISDTKTVVTKQLNISNSILIDRFLSLLNSDGEYNTKLTPRFLFIGSSYLGGLTYGLDDQGSRDLSIDNLHVLSSRYNHDFIINTTDNLIISFDEKDTYSESVAGKKSITGNLYNGLYKNDEELTTNDDSMFLVSQFDLTSKDVSEIDFNDIIYLETVRYGNSHYRLNELSNYQAGNNKKTRTELVQVDLAIVNAPEFSSSEITLNQVFLSSDNQEKKDKLTNSGVIV